MKNNKSKEFNHKSSQKTQNQGSVWIYGFHPVKMALSNPDRRIFRIIATKEAIKESGIKFNPQQMPQIKERREIEAYLPQGSLHQGIAIEASLLPPIAVEDICALALNKRNAVVVALDQVTDPHNVGAILRSSAAFNALAVMIPDRNSSPETGVLAKSASGALDIVPIARVSNFVNALEKLKESGFWVVGLDGEAKQELPKINMPEKIVLVLGSEGEGMRRLTAETCDFMAKLPISDKMESLNVSNAAAIALYEINRKQS